MKTSDEYTDPKELAYMEMMVSSLSKIPKIPPTTTQCASTQAILDRPKEKDAEWWNRPLLNWRANPNAKTLDEAVGMRTFDATQVALAEDIRHKGRNALGCSEGSSVTTESKEKAVNAFMYYPPGPLTPEQIKKSIKMTKIVVPTLGPPEPLAALKPAKKPWRMGMIPRWSEVFSDRTIVWALLVITALCFYLTEKNEKNDRTSILNRPVAKP